MDLKKIVFIISIGVYAVPVTPLGLPRFTSLSVRPLISKLVQVSNRVMVPLCGVSNAVFTYMGNHKIKSTVALGSFLALANPKTRQPIVKFACSCAGITCVFLGFVCSSQRLLALGGRLAFQVTPLHVAALRGDVAEVQSLIGVNAQDSLGHLTPLHCAAAIGGLEVVQALLRAGADVNAQGRLRITPLSLAAAMGGEPAVVQALLAAGARVNAQDDMGMTSLHWIAEGRWRLESGQFLIDAGANIDAQDGKQRTPLHYAADNGHLEMVRALIRAGANTRTQDDQHHTALDLAIARNHRDIVDCLRAVSRSTSAV
jgi:hypothetical protein